ncbi:nucleotidyltransferase family protein [Paraglaciecola arctica]|uniref:nucleotidyltransferase family protein n=1 Tax=Paraglaciecola arctica TaxID=1128911 RepID=UPI001C070711|nr:nucleotidyltransferase family protein [Paraglaciecola arctica]MBU3005692.1 nucleotidyltransferase family protein [Paraglaciecola arctica]
MSIFSNQQLASFLIAPEGAVDLPLELWAKLILIFRESKLLASFYHVSIAKECFELYPEYAQKHLFAASIHASRQKAQVLFESESLRVLLAKIDVNPIFLKGANYILRNSLNSEGRIVSDIDILVKKDEIENVESALKSALWQSEKLSDYDEKYYRNWAHEIPPLFHVLRETVLDVHHNFYLPISGRSPNVILFSSTVETVAGGCLVLGKAETVLHSIIHLFMNEDFTNAFRDLFDIHLLVNEYESSEFWRSLEILASKTQFEKELYYCLVLLMNIFGTQEPSIFPKLRSRYKSLYSDFFINKILFNGIMPRHSLLNNYKNSTSRFLIFIRGHWLKMPIHILISHLAIKSYKGTLEFLFGKYFLDEK